MKPLSIQAQPYSPGRAQGRVRMGRNVINREDIVVVTQQELAGFRGGCKGLVVIDGAPFSHTMIRTQGYGIPAVIITAEQALLLPRDREMVMDGHTGLIFDSQLLSQHPELHFEPPGLSEPLMTCDGEQVMLRASAGNRAAIKRSIECGANAIGLLRMEFLGSQNKATPDAGFYVNELCALCQTAAPIPLTARLPDFSAEKLPIWALKMMQAANIKDCRGMRAFHEAPFLTLLNHILEGVSRCYEQCDLRLLLPYIDSIDEFIHWRDYLRPKLPGKISIGAMLETVNAAENINGFFNEADFIALGTNDMIANLLDCERDSRAMNAYEPVIYQLLQHVAQQAGDKTKQVQLNGQLSRMPGVMPILLGLGYRIFSFDPLLIPYFAQKVKQVDTAEAATLAKRVCGASDNAEVKTILEI